MAAALVLAGCSSLSGIDPVAWWHDLEGGPVADARPPPPNADAPYPNLASVPDRPAGSDAAQRGQIANALVADRRNAQYDASLAPLPPAGAKLPTPAPVAPQAAASPDSETSNASLATASAAPAPPTPAAPTPAAPAPPRRAPVPPVQATPLAPVAAAPGPAAAVPATAAALPPIPDQPPAPPALPGVAQATAPTAPPATPSPPQPPPAAPVATAVDAVAFPAGSGLLPSAALPGLRALASRRAGGTVAVLGFGEATGTEPAAQQAAMPLALARARAIATALQGAGVPASAIRIDAEAAGQGGVVRLIR